jgi:hypothetical protein
MLGTPATPPTGLISQLRDILSARSEVVEAWFAIAHWPENAERSWYLDVRTYLQRTEVTAMLADVLKEAPFDGLPLDMIVRQPDETQGTGLRIAPSVSP